MEDREGKRDPRRTKNELPPDILKEIIAAGGPQAARKPDEQAIAAMTATPASAGPAANPATGGGSPEPASWSLKGKATEGGVKPTEYTLWEKKFSTPEEPKARALSAGHLLDASSKPLHPAPDARPSMEAKDQPQRTLSEPGKIIDPAKDVAKAPSKPTSEVQAGATHTLWAKEKVFLGKADGNKVTGETKLEAEAAVSRDQDGKWTAKAGVNQTVDANAVYKNKIGDAGAIDGNLHAGAKASAGGSLSYGPDGPAAKVKAGVEAGLDGSASYTHAIGKGETIAGKITGNVKASAEASAGISLEGIKAKAELGASVGADVGGAYSKAGHTIGGAIGVEAGGAGGFKGDIGFKGGVISLGLDAKLVSGVGAKVKAEFKYDTNWIKTSAQKLVADANNANSSLGKALAAAQDSTLQKVSVVSGAAAQELQRVGTEHGKFFGDPVRKVGEATGVVAKVTDRTVSVGEKIEAVATYGGQKGLNLLTERVNLADVMAKVKDGKTGLGDKALVIAKAGGEVIASPILGRVDAVKEAIATFKGSGGVGDKAMAVGKAVIKILPGGHPAINFIKSFF